METFYGVDGIFKQEVGDGLFNTLCDIYPEGRLGKSGVIFEFTLPKDDPRTRSLLRELEAHDYRLLAPRTEQRQSSLLLNIIREYRPHDLARFSYLQPEPTELLGLFRRREGTMVISTRDEDLRPGRDIFGTEDFDIIVSDRLRRWMQGAGLQGLVFRETVIEAHHPRLKNRFPDPFWELDTDIFMPPLSSRTVLIGNNDEPYDGDPNKVWLPREGLTPPESLY